MQLKPLTEKNISEYKEFLDSEVKNKKYFFPGDPLQWARVNEKIFHWPCMAYLVSDNSEICGFFIFNKVNKRLVSLPHASYSGTHLKSIRNNSEEYQLILKKLNDSLSPKPKGWHIRLRFPLEYFDSRKVASWLNIDDTSSLWASLSSNLRRKIRKAERTGFSCKRGKGELLDEFFRAYSLRMKQIGSFPLMKPYIEESIKNVENSIIFIMYKNDKIAGGALLQGNGYFYENTLIAVLSEYYKNYASDFLHWQMIAYTYSCNGGIYSFGRSTKDSPVHYFKSHWPTHNVQLYWSSDSPVNKSNLRYIHFPSAITRILLPTFLYHHLSKFISRIIY